jgi:RNA polymerase sigma-70 factor (ECF subfamily)
VIPATQPEAAPRSPLPGAPPLAPPPALEALYQAHHGAVLRAAYRITGDAADAEDVLQTVFVRLLRREDEVDLSASASSYLHRAAVNAALDLLRARRRARAVPLGDVEGVLEEPAPGPERSRGGRELARDLRAALTRLTPRSAEIFALRYFEDYTNLEIARLLGVSQTAIAVILHRTRHRLRKELGALGGLS